MNNPELTVHGFWIMDSTSGLTLVKRNYVTLQAEEEDKLIAGYFSALLSFAQNAINIPLDGVLIQEKKIVYDIGHSIVFVIIANRDANSVLLQQIVSQIRANFFRRFPHLATGSWVFDGKLLPYRQYQNTINQIITKFSAEVTPLKIVLVGLDRAGKTTLAHAFSERGVKTDYVPTMGIDIIRMQYNDWSISLWDLGGQRSFRQLWLQFAKEASGLIFVIDSTNKTRWKEVNLVLNDLITLFDIPYVVIANKQDLIDRADPPRKIAENLGIKSEKIYPASALLSQGILPPLNDLLSQIGKTTSSKDQDRLVTDFYVIREKIHSQGLSFLRFSRKNRTGAIKDLLQHANYLLDFTMSFVVQFNENFEIFETISTRDDFNIKDFIHNTYETIVNLKEELESKNHIVMKESNKYGVNEELYKKKSLIILPLKITDTIKGFYFIVAQDRPEYILTEIVNCLEKVNEYLELEIEIR